MTFTNATATAITSPVDSLVADLRATGNVRRFMDVVMAGTLPPVEGREMLDARLNAEDSVFKKAQSQ